MENGWTQRVEELEAEVAKLTGDLPPMQLTDNERRDGHSALRWNKGKQAIETFDPHPSVGLTDDERKVLTEYIGDRLHEVKRLPDRWKCSCGEIFSFPETEYAERHVFMNRKSFAATSDLRAVYSKMANDHKEEIGPYTLWDSFYDYAMDLYNEEFNPIECVADTCHFTAWLFCLACPEQIPERMKMAAGWIRAKG